MPAIFPPALVDCVRLGTTPTREQLGAVALHIWRDWCNGFGLPCDGMPRDPDVTATMRSLAWLALTGDAGRPSLFWNRAIEREPDEQCLLDVA